MKLIPKENYFLTRPGVNQLILVNIDKFMDRLKNDDPYFFIGPETKIPLSQIRIEKSIEYINNKVNHQSILEPTQADIFEGKLGIIDGRHRIAALKKMEYTHAYIEVPKEQKDLFNDLA
jgi:hypothetical protein